MTLLAKAVALVAALAASAGGGSAPAGAGAHARAAAPPAVAQTARSDARAHRRRANVVFILTDDLSWNLVRFMPQVRAMQREGMTFTNYFATDSLCCPSRASIFTGQYPHNHGVVGNTAPTGGFVAFRRGGGQNRSFATRLRSRGYRTALMGKYFNEYAAHSRYVPPGWSDWQVPSGAYDGFGYVLGNNGHLAHFGRARRAYFTDVAHRMGVRFIRHAARRGKPFFLEIATFAPHKPYTPAPRDRHDFPGLIATRDAAFDATVSNAPSWLRHRRPLDASQMATLDRDFRRRAQSVQAVDDMIRGIRRLLKRRHMYRNTYLVFSSDNGYHMGQRRLMAGKMTAYDSDIRVPLVVVGPRVPRGTVNRAMASNIDLAPTFMHLGGIRAPSWVDGQSIVKLLHGRTPARWRDAVLVEHHHPPTPEGDPDAQTRRSGNPPSYEALRTKRELYVEYANGEREWYDLTSDPDELDNRYDELDFIDREYLHERLAELRRCRGADCRAAALG
jgi:N-acetylglucosamine-6-sulfatase